VVAVAEAGAGNSLLMSNRKSGVMTFLVNQDGVTYQSDLGDHTIDLAQQFDSFNPDDSWQPVE